MRAFVWTRQQRGKVFGLKKRASQDAIKDWVVKWKDGTWHWEMGELRDGVIRGPYKTSREAMKTVERERGLEGLFCAHCGSPMAQRLK